nr:hypothetical protein BCU55_13710 [Shewanella sp. 10N.286.48.A6]
MECSISLLIRLFGSDDIGMLSDTSYESCRLAKQKLMLPKTNKAINKLTTANLLMASIIVVRLFVLTV